MATQDNEPEQRVVAVVLISLIALIVAGVLGLGVFKARGDKAGATTASTAPAAAAAAMAPGAVAISATDASVVVDNGVVKFYFATGKADLASGALVALAEAIEAAKAGSRLVISGFHDATGDPAFNAELAKQRALAVRNALTGAGVAEGNLELSKPAVTTGSGADAEARRVEVVIIR
jgi:outer membrane protein OmpA-like peptidoglycan-associated protein